MQGVRRDGDNTTLDVASDGRRITISGDALLLATGRVPNTDLLEVANSGVEVDSRGFIKTDEHLETNVPGIWALGDIVGRYLLKHSANLEAAYAANNIFNSDAKVAVDYHAMPHAIFALPQVAGVGLTVLPAGREARVGRRRRSEPDDGVGAAHGAPDPRSAGS